MENKSVVLILIICLIVGAFLGINYKATKNNPELVSETTCPESSLGSLNVKSIYQSDDFYYINIEYPEFIGAEESFNKQISDTINTRLKEFKDSSSSNWQARKETDSSLKENPETPFYFSSSWTPVQVNENYISFVIDVYSFSGGAHGDEEVYSFNYDVKGRKEITFNDFINSSDENLKTIAKLATEDVQNMVDKQSIFAEGTTADINNFGTFTFNRDLLTIYYQKYQVAPGSFGILKSIFNKKTLEENKLDIGYFK